MRIRFEYSDLMLFKPLFNSTIKAFRNSNDKNSQLLHYYFRYIGHLKIMIFGSFLFLFFFAFFFREYRREKHALTASVLLFTLFAQKKSPKIEPFSFLNANLR